MNFFNQEKTIRIYGWFFLVSMSNKYEIVPISVFIDKMSFNKYYEAFFCRIIITPTSIILQLTLVYFGKNSIG